MTQRKTSLIGNLFRGFLIGAVETVPGVSGGTVALVVGIYHQIIDSASHVISAGKKLLTGPERAKGFTTEMAKVHWKIIIPVGLAMVVAVFTIAGPMSRVIESYPEHTRGLFFGMVLASIAVPVNMMLNNMRHRRTLMSQMGKDPAHIRFRWWHLAAGLFALVATFILVSLPPTNVEPQPWVLLPAAAVGVSALVLPGLSGSFLLLTFGLYEPTLRAVDELNFAYLGVFAAGMVLGMILVVKALKWLLENHHTLTLAILTGVMAGGLRTLWPWQDETRNLVPPTDLGVIALLALAGFIVVSVLVVVDQRLAHKTTGQSDSH